MSAQYESITGNSVQMDGERYFQTMNTHLMPEFFCRWLDPAITGCLFPALGALTAGRCDPDLALFPAQRSNFCSESDHRTLYFDLSPRRENLFDDHWEPFHRATPRNAVSQTLQDATN